MFDWLPEKTQSSWTFIIVVLTFLIKIIGLIIYWIKKIIIRIRLNNLDCHYLIPSRDYSYRKFPNAPIEQDTPKKLTISFGIYSLLLEIKSGVYFQFAPIIISFSGNENNKPIYLDTDNPYIIDKLVDGSLRNWWGQVIPPIDKYPRNHYKDEALIHGIRIKTTGNWVGKINVQIRLIGGTIINKYLDLIVSEQDDEVPFLKIKENQIQDTIEGIEQSWPTRSS